jgi:hypothetical protein
VRGPPSRAIIDLRTGKRTESDEHFATATSMYRDTGTMYWLQRAEREPES